MVVSETVEVRHDPWQIDPAVDDQGLEESDPPMTLCLVVDLTMTSFLSFQPQTLHGLCLPQSQFHDGCDSAF